MGKTNGKTVKVALDYEQDSKRFHRYIVAENDKGIVGTIYFSKDKDVPDELIMEVKDTE